MISVLGIEIVRVTVFVSDLAIFFANATTLSQKGVSVRVLAEMAGHRSIQTTQRYIDVNDDMMRNAAELI